MKKNKILKKSKNLLKIKVITKMYHLRLKRKKEKNYLRIY